MDAPNAGWELVIIAVTQVSNILPARYGESVRWNVRILHYTCGRVSLEFILMIGLRIKRMDSD